MLKRNTVIYIPYYKSGSQTNAYIVRMIHILNQKYTVEGRLLGLFHMFRTKAVFLNWVEAHLDYKKRLQIFLYKLSGAKIIWVFHNKMPHETLERNENTVFKKNMVWLAHKASHIVLHSKNSIRYIPDFKKNKFKCVYIPHLLYEQKKSKTQIQALREKYQIDEDTFVFTMTGFMKPYKHFENGIAAFKNLNLKHSKLILAGSSENGKYIKFLKRLCSGCKDIILDLRYIPNITLNAILEISDVVVVPYENETSMNSGVMIQAFSNERTVIVPNICMAQDFAPQGFFYRYQNSLEETMRKAYNRGKDANREMGMRAYQYVKKHNSEKAVEKKLYELLETGRR